MACLFGCEVRTGSSSSRGKRARTAFSAQQIKSLESEFEKNRYLSVAARGRLARQLRLTETQQYYSSLGIVAPRPMFVGDRLWVFNYPNRPPHQQWMKSINTLTNTNQMERNMFRLPKPDVPPFLIPPTFPNERFLLDRNLPSVKLPAPNRLPREVFNNMASAHRSLDVYKNNILSHSPPQETN
ncbi:BarH-like 1 homeobox protein, partial [Operophtera brumata]